jgi:hypothetical protein
MKVESLTFQVRPPELTDDFISLDSEIWDPWLQRQKGFLRKEQKVVQRTDHAEVNLRILWKGDEDLEKASAKGNELKALETRLSLSFPGTYHLVRSKII